MKNIIISADGDRMVYLVPDDVADRLEEYCMEFCNKWIWTSPHAKKHRTGNVISYTERDFIEYLNNWIFPNQHSELIENLGWIDFDKELPDKYKNNPQFNF